MINCNVESKLNYNVRPTTEDICGICALGDTAEIVAKKIPVAKYQ